MAAPKHTPGPWHVGGFTTWDPITGRPYRFVYRGSGESVETRVRVGGGDGENGTAFDCDADAILIAAAPDLLEALEALVAEQNGPPLLGRHERAWREAMAKSKAAIAKAKGEA